MSADIQARTLRRVMAAFNQPLIENVLRGAYVEAMVAELLGADWQLTETWAAWDMEHSGDGTRVEVKQSAARQTWSKSTLPRPPAPVFSIRKPSGIWTRDDEWLPCDRRPADIYVFAWHDRVENADQRDPGQWTFFVISERALPAQDSIGLGALGRIAEPVDAAGLGERVDAVRLRIDRALRWTPAIRIMPSQSIVETGRVAP